jgi:TetR/AcrR family transcriptional regulator, cholesterol catabolism regulator
VLQSLAGVRSWSGERYIEGMMNSPVTKRSRARDRAGPSRKYQATGDRKPRDERWAQLLQVAAEVFAEKGYDRTSLQELATRTGILKGSIYYYITTKEELLAHLIREANEKGLAQIQPIAEGDGNPIDRLAGMISAHIRYVCTERERTAVFIRESKRLTPQLRKEYLGDEHAYRNLFQKVIAEGRQAGLIHHAVDPKLAALCLLGSLNSLYDWYRPSGGFPIKAIAEHFAMTALSGMTTERGESAAKSVRTQNNRKRAPATAA